MTDNDASRDEKRKRLLAKDWVIIGLSIAVLLLLVGYTRTLGANSRLRMETEKLENDLQLIGVVISTYIETRQKEFEVMDQLCEEKLNQGYLQLYEKLKLRSDSIRYFKKRIEEAAVEKQDLISQRNDKAASYNTYAQSLDWDAYQKELYNLPEKIEPMAGGN